MAGNVHTGRKDDSEALEGHGRGGAYMRSIEIAAQIKSMLCMANIFAGYTVAVILSFKAFAGRSIGTRFDIVSLQAFFYMSAVNGFVVFLASFKE